MSQNVVVPGKPGHDWTGGTIRNRVLTVAVLSVLLVSMAAPVYAHAADAVVICADGHGKMGTKIGDYVVAFALAP